MSALLRRPQAGPNAAIAAAANRPIGRPARQGALAYLRRARNRLTLLQRAATATQLLLLLFAGPLLAIIAAAAKQSPSSHLAPAAPFACRVYLQLLALVSVRSRQQALNAEAVKAALQNGLIQVIHGAVHLVRQSVLQMHGRIAGVGEWHEVLGWEWD